MQSVEEFSNTRGIVSLFPDGSLSPHDSLLILAASTVIFNMPPVHCPPAGECFRQLFGMSNLTCSESACDRESELYHMGDTQTAVE